MPQQLIIEPRGLVTQPNPSGAIAAGSFWRALRVNMRDPKIPEVAHVWTTIAAPDGSLGASMVYGVLGSGGATLIVPIENTPGGGWLLRYYNTNTGALLFAAINFRSEPGANWVQWRMPLDGRFGSVAVRKRLFLTTSTGPIAFDVQTPSSAAECYPRPAGMAPVNIGNVFASPTVVGGALKNDRACHVVAVIRRKYSDGYEIFSAPSVAAHIGNGSGSATNMTVNLRLNATYHRAGDIVDLYRTYQQEYVPAACVNTGQDYYLSTSHVLTSAEVTANLCQLEDPTPDTAIGESLYTNQGVRTANAAAFPPPPAKCVAEFRGHTFYGNTTDPPSIRFRVPVYWGDMGADGTGAVYNARYGGVGRRSFTGNTALGVNTITSVSGGNMVGIKVGQLLTFGGGVFVLGTKVTAAAGTTITLSNNASGTTVGTGFVLTDVIEINGTDITAGSMSEFVASFAATFPNGSAALFAQCLGRVYPDQTLYPGIRMATVPADWMTVHTLFQSYGSAPLTIRATNGRNYAPTLPSIEGFEPAQIINPTPVPNQVSWSELNSPENRPAVNIQPVGRTEVIALTATRDMMLVWTLDGLFRCSGTGGRVGVGYDWRFDPIDSNLVLAGPQAWCVLRDSVHAYTNRGHVVVDSSGSITELSNGRIGDLLPPEPWTPPTRWAPSNAVWMVADDVHDEVLIRAPSTSDANASPGQVFVYNLLTDAYTQDTTLLAAEASANSYNAAWVEREAAVIAVCQSPSSSDNYVLRRGRDDAATLATSNFVFQPVYTDNPFSIKHWQLVDTTWDGSAVTAAVITTIATQYNKTSTDRASRSNVAALANTTEFARARFGIPKGSPSMAANIAVGITTSLPSPNTAGLRLRLQGLALLFEAQTDQSRKR